MAEIRDYSVTADDNNASSPNGMAENCAPSTVNNTWRESVARMKRWYEDISGVKVTAGSSNTYTLSASRTVASYAQGDAYLFEANHTNTGAATINVDSLGAKSIVHNDGTALRAGDITAAGMYLIAYEANNDRFILVGGLGSAQNLYINNSSPNIMLENSSNENSDGGRESTIQIKGKQDGNEITTLATIVTSHDGSSDDQKGKMLISINDGDDGDSPSKVAAKFDSDGNAHFAQSVVTNSIIATASNITVDAQGDDTDIILKGTDGGADTTFLTIDGSDAGTASFNHDVKLANDAAVLGFGAGNDVTLTHVHDSGLTLSAGANKTTFTLVSTDGDANGAPRVDLKRDSASPAADDVLGMIRFYGENDADEETQYARIYVQALDVSDGSEDGRMYLQTMRNGTQSTGILLDTDKIDLTAANINIGGDAHITDECVVTNERAATYILRAYDSADNLNFAVRENGYFQTGTDTYSPYNFTTAQAANGNVSSGGYLRRSTSSLRFKKDVVDIADDWADKLLELKPIFYKSTALGDIEDNDASWTYYGFGAEDVVKVDPRYVHLKTHEFSHNAETGEDTKTKLDEPIAEGVQYDRMVPGLINIIKRLTKRVEALEAR